MCGTSGQARRFVDKLDEIVLLKKVYSRIPGDIKLPYMLMREMSLIRDESKRSCESCIQVITSLQVRTLTGGSEAVTVLGLATSPSLSQSSSSERIVAGYHDGLIKLWNVHEAAVITTFRYDILLCLFCP